MDVLFLNTFYGFFRNACTSEQLNKVTEKNVYDEKPELMLFIIEVFLSVGLLP
jgi:hypothetical protein